MFLGLFVLNYHSSSPILILSRQLTTLFTAPDGSQIAFLSNECGLLTHIVSNSANIKPVKTITMTKVVILADNIFRQMIIVTIMTTMDKLRLITWIYTNKAINSIVLAMIITAMIKPGV